MYMYLKKYPLNNNETCTIGKALDFVTTGILQAEISQMWLAKNSSISAKFEIHTGKSFSFYDLNDRNNMAERFYFQNSVERAKGNYQEWKQQRTYKNLGHCLVDLRWKTKDTVLIFSVSYNANQPSAGEVRCEVLLSSALLAAIEEGERMKNGSFQSLFNSSEVQATRSRRRPLETVFPCCGDQRNNK